MKVGMIGLGRMGEGMSRRLIAAGHEVHGFRNNYAKAEEQFEKGYISGCTTSVESLVQVVHNGQGVFGEVGYTPGVFMMVVPAETVEDTLDELLQFCVEGDIIIDHGNSNFKDSRRRAERLSKLGIAYIDCGTSGGVYGLERGYCLMVGGSNTAVSVCRPIFDALSPGLNAAPRTCKRDGYVLYPEEYGWMHCGGPGAGHFVKMVHNGIEYGIMQAYAEGFNILHEANAGAAYVAAGDAEVAPMDCPADYCYDIDVSKVAECWRRGSVVGSWLLDLTADVLRRDRELSKFDGGVSDSGEGRWTVHAAVDLGVPAPVISSALWARFESRRLGAFTAKVLNGMRAMFGGHDVR
jgi:6-phosphogluconate dehydrogenase